MPSPPDTRQSLIARLSDPADAEAWQAFWETTVEARPLLFELTQV